MNERIRYFEWLAGQVVGDHRNYNKLLSYLFDSEFTWLLPLDENRISNGLLLRHYYCYYNNLPREIEYKIKGPCNILEIMVSLSISMSDLMSISEDYWFWEMLKSLDLCNMDDRRFNKDYVDFIISRFLNREYEPDGSGGLFTAEGHGDMRKVDIWYQMMFYLDNFVEKGVV